MARVNGVALCRYLYNNGMVSIFVYNGFFILQPQYYISYIAMQCKNIFIILFIYFE